ncbi:hypothetical protein IE81DRAFT_322343 [Ceraceosorus guamensis]|uniref:Uncharacterized protein n=1 Tax=Ceraceosorus guamensis TaxID=1522189 RepID=A0A316W0W0_9BASI|nr:hypothetical protein IE81DRAFT_322343 [Ceraceosorus guamensis]PWN43486.1 hypothetical protein IE81DRAFT_322343 [Ceraceosorus guamensis]
MTILSGPSIDLVYPSRELEVQSQATELMRRETLEPRLAPSPCCYPFKHPCCKETVRRGLELTTERRVPTTELERRHTDGKPSTDLILSKRDKLEPRQVIPCCFGKIGGCCPPPRRFHEIADLMRRVAADDMARLVSSAKDESQNTKRSSLQKRMLGAEVQQESEYS